MISAERQAIAIELEVLELLPDELEDGFGIDAWFAPYHCTISLSGSDEEFRWLSGSCVVVSAAPIPGSSPSGSVNSGCCGIEMLASTLVDIASIVAIATAIPQSEFRI